MLYKRIVEKMRPNGSSLARNNVANERADCVVDFDDGKNDGCSWIVEHSCQSVDQTLCLLGKFGTVVVGWKRAD